MSEISDYPQALQPFVSKLNQTITEAREADNKRELSQLEKILQAVDENQPVQVYRFWSSSVKELAAEWEKLRTSQVPETEQVEISQSEEDAADLTESTEAVDTTNEAENADPASTTEKPKRSYRKITIEGDENPFRVGSKNAMVYELLRKGGHTIDQMAEESGANLKSVGYVIWLLNQSFNYATVYWNREAIPGNASLSSPLWA